MRSPARHLEHTVVTAHVRREIPPAVVTQTQAPVVRVAEEKQEARGRQ